MRQQLLTLQKLSGNQELLPPQRWEPADVLWRRSCNASGTIPPTSPSPSFYPCSAWWNPKTINCRWQLLKQCEEWTPPTQSCGPRSLAHWGKPCSSLSGTVSAFCAVASLKAAHLWPPQRPLCMTQLPESAEGLCCLLLWRLINLKKDRRSFSHFHESPISLAVQDCSGALPFLVSLFNPHPANMTLMLKQSHSLSTDASGEKTTWRAGAGTYGSGKTGGAQATVGSFAGEEFH